MADKFLFENIVKEAVDEMKRQNLRENNENSKNLWPLNIWNGYVVLKHESPAKIKVGKIDRALGKTNHYSTRSDSGNYFWGSSIIGKDNSNGQEFTYFCLVPQEDVYDMMKNEKQYQDANEAMRHEDYIAYNWPATKGAVVVRTFIQTPISYISYRPHFSYHNEIGGLYDSNWNLLRAYGYKYDKKEVKKLLKKLELTKDVELPDFLNSEHDYDYDKLLEVYKNLPKYC